MPAERHPTKRIPGSRVSSGLDGLPQGGWYSLINLRRRISTALKQEIWRNNSVGNKVALVGDCWAGAFSPGTGDAITPETGSRALL